MKLVSILTTMILIAGHVFAADKMIISGLAPSSVGISGKSVFASTNKLCSSFTVPIPVLIPAFLPRVKAQVGDVSRSSDGRYELAISLTAPNQTMEQKFCNYKLTDIMMSLEMPALDGYETKSRTMTYKLTTPEQYKDMKAKNYTFGIAKEEINKTNCSYDVLDVPFDHSITASLLCTVAPVQVPLTGYLDRTILVSPSEFENSNDIRWNFDIEVDQTNVRMLICDLPGNKCRSK